MRLSNSDLQRVLSSINVLTSDHDPQSLARRTTDSVQHLVSSDVLSFEGFGTDNDYRGALWYTPVGAISATEYALMAELVYEHPCYEDVAAKRLRDAVRVSDYLPIVKFKRTAIYNEIFRSIGTDRQMVAGLHVTPELLVSVSLCRLRKDYTDRDCAIFDLLTPHLISAFHNAQFINRLKSETEQFQMVFEFTKYGIATINNNFEILIENPVAARLIGKYFGGDSLSIPDELKRYINHCNPKACQDEFYLPPIPMHIRNQNGELKIRFHFHAESQTTVLLLEEVSKNITGMGLTRRESDVIYQISRGKTDTEIALILKISVRTVQKHVEHIFEKLGVENRTAAASFVN